MASAYPSENGLGSPGLMGSGLGPLINPGDNGGRNGDNGKSNRQTNGQTNGQRLCPLCRKPMEDERMLPCLHSLCLSCIENHGSNLVCPNCKKGVNLDQPLNSLASVDLQSDLQGASGLSSGLPPVLPTGLASNGQSLLTMQANLTSGLNNYATTASIQPNYSGSLQSNLSACSNPVSIPQSGLQPNPNSGYSMFAPTLQSLPSLMEMVSMSEANSGNLNSNYNSGNLNSNYSSSLDNSPTLSSNLNVNANYTSQMNLNNMSPDCMVGVVSPPEDRAPGASRPRVRSGGSSGSGGPQRHPLACASCEEEVMGSFKCQECNEVLCDNCVIAHKRVRLTKDHTIHRLEDVLQAIALPTNVQGTLQGNVQGNLASPELLQYNPRQADYRQYDNSLAVNLASADLRQYDNSLANANNLQGNVQGNVQGNLQGNVQGNLGSPELLQYNPRQADYRQYDNALAVNPANVDHRQYDNAPTRNPSNADHRQYNNAPARKPANADHRQYNNAPARKPANTDHRQYKRYGRYGGGRFAEAPPLYCVIHERELARCYCETCSLILCAVCATRDHRSHCCRSIREATDSWRSVTMKVINDLQAGLANFEEGMDIVQRTKERMENEAQWSIKMIRETTKQHIAAIEARQKQLLHNVEHIRQIKAKSLKEQADNLNGLIMRYRHTINQAMSTVNRMNHLELLHTRDKVIADIKEFASYTNLVQPFEDDVLSFSPPDPSLLHALQNMGRVWSTGYAATTRAHGHGTHTGFVSKMAIFVIRSRDHLNEPRFAGGDPLAAEIVGPDGLPIPMELIDRGNGRYRVSFWPNMEGQHQVTIKLRGINIYGSPFTVNVKEKPRTYEDLGKNLMVIGGDGRAEGRFCRPWGVCSDIDGHIVVADRSNNRIQVFMPDGTFSHAFSHRGPLPGELNRPAGVTCNNLNQIVVADKDNHRIQIFTFDGRFLSTFGTKGQLIGQFNYPWDVATNSLGEIAVSDTRNHRIQLFKPDGTFIRKYGYDGVYSKQFDSPRGLCFTNDGYLICTDFNQHRIITLSPTFETAKYMGGEGLSPGLFLRPQGVAIDPQAHLVVTDSRNHRIQIFTPEGNFVCKFGNQGYHPGEFERPSGICVTPDGYIVVVDFGHDRLQVF